MTSHLRSRTAGLVLATLAVLAGAHVARAEDGILLRYSTKEGDQSVYQMVMEGTTTVFVSDKEQKTSLTTEMFVTQKVLEAKNAVIKMLTQIDSGSINVNGTQSVIPNLKQKVVTTMEPTGKILTTEGFNQQMNLNNMQLVFPEKAVQVGYSWKNRIEPTLQVPVPLDVEYRILKTETIKGFECIKIASTVRSGDKSTIEGLSLDVQADGTIYFAYKLGKMIKNEVKSSMRMILKRVVDNKQQSIITKMTMNMRMEHQY
jgi:hypothetical protein